MKRTVVLASDQQSGKAAFKGLVKAFGGQDAVAAETGDRQQKISDMGLANVPIFPPLDLIDLLEDRTVGHPGWPHVTSWLCRRRGGVFVPLPAASIDAEAITGCVIEMAAELGDVSRSVSDALSGTGAGGTAILPSEAAQVRVFLAALIQTATTLDLAMASREEGDAS